MLFFDIIVTLSTDIRVHRAGSQLKNVWKSDKSWEPEKIWKFEKKKIWKFKNFNSKFKN